MCQTPGAKKANPAGGHMRRSWEWLGLNLGKHAGIVACLGIVLTVVLGAGLGDVRFSTSNSDYLDHNDPAAIGTKHRVIY